MTHDINTQDITQVLRFQILLTELETLLVILSCDNFLLNHIFNSTHEV